MNGVNQIGRRFQGQVAETRSESVSRDVHRIRILRD